MEKLNDVLQHYGVKGMKWGIRGETGATRKRLRSYNKGMRLMDRVRLKKMSSSEARKQYLDAKDKDWMAKVKDDKNIQKVSKRAAKEFKKLNKQIKEQFGGRGLKGEAKRVLDGSLNAAYHKTMKDAYTLALADQTFSVYKLSPSRIREVNIIPNQDGTLKAVIVERQNPKLAKQRTAINKAADKLKHADSSEDGDVTNLDGMVFIIIPDDDGFPDEVIAPFDFEETEDDTIQQAGIKGMKWGIRRDYDRPGGADGKPDAKDKPIRTALGRKLNSLKRERQWNSVLKEMDSLSTKDITEVTRRVTLENGLKALSRSKIGTKKDREDYLRRERMDNEELSRKVTRLKAKESLHSAVKNASKEQREFGQKLVQIGSSLGVKYALTKSITPKDVFDTVKNPKASSDKAKSDLLKVALEKIKSSRSNT